MESITILFNYKGNRLAIKAKKSECIDDVFDRFIFQIKENKNDLKFYYKSMEFRAFGITLEKLGIQNFTQFDVVNDKYMTGAGGGFWYEKEINIKFIKISKNILNSISDSELTGPLKLCLLKEISSKLSDEQIEKLPELTLYIMEILKNGYIEENDIKKNIAAVLAKVKGSNIINFSNFVNESINMNQVNEMMKILNSNDFKEINDIRFLLSKYNEHIKLFNKEFEKAKRESIFEFSIISLVIMEREDFEKFEEERKNCPNRIDQYYSMEQVLNLSLVY